MKRGSQSSKARAAVMTAFLVRPSCATHGVRLNVEAIIREPCRRGHSCSPFPVITMTVCFMPCNLRLPTILLTSNHFFPPRKVGEACLKKQMEQHKE